MDLQVELKNWQNKLVRVKRLRLDSRRNCFKPQISAVGILKESKRTFSNSCPSLCYILSHCKCTVIELQRWLTDSNRLRQTLVLFQKSDKYHFLSKSNGLCRNPLKSQRLRRNPDDFYGLWNQKYSEIQKCFLTPANIHTKWLEVRKQISKSNQSLSVSAKVRQSCRTFPNCYFI